MSIEQGSVSPSPEELQKPSSELGEEELSLLREEAESTGQPLESVIKEYRKWGQFFEKVRRRDGEEIPPEIEDSMRRFVKDVMEMTRKSER